MNRPFIVGVNGLARAGKDTSVGIVLDLFKKTLWLGPYTAGRYAFADELKELYESFTHVPTDEICEWVALSFDEHMYRDCVFFFRDLRSRRPDLAVHYNRKDDQDKVKHRPNLIDVGLFFRSLNQDFWVNKVLDHIISDDHDFAFITDVRFLNELAITDYNARILRPGTVVLRREDGTVDPSEQLAVAEDIKFDYIINNLKDIEYLEEELRPFVLSVVKHAQHRGFLNNEILMHK